MSTTMAWVAPVIAFLLMGCAGGDAMNTESVERSSDRPDLVPAAESRDRGDTFHQLNARGEGNVVVIFTPSEGWAHRRDPNREPEGVMVEILRDFFEWVEEREGVRAEATWVEEAEWGRFYRRVRDAAGGVLGIGNVTITEERREEVDFSPPYLSNVAVLITHADVPELSSLEEAPSHFSGFIACPRRGTLHEDRIEGLRDRGIPDFRVQYLNSSEAVISAVLEGPDRLAWVDVHNFWRAAENGAPIRRHPSADDHTESLGIILPRGSDWTPLLETFFLEGEGYRNSLRFHQLLDTHLGEELAQLLRAVGKEAVER